MIQQHDTTQLDWNGTVNTPQYTTVYLVPLL